MATLSDLVAAEADCKQPEAEVERLRAVLVTTRAYIADQTIAHAVVIPRGQRPSGNDPSLLAVIDAALANSSSMEPKV